MPQLILRQYYDLNYRLFTNLVLLKHKNSRAMVHYVAKSHSINVVVVGTPSPQEFLKALVEIFEIVVANRLRREQCPTKRLCPRCIQGAGIYSTVETALGSCSAGHTLSHEDMKDGVLWEKRSWCRNSIWTSKVRSFAPSPVHRPISLSSPDPRDILLVGRLAPGRSL